jgi:hypothetical protein
MKAAENGHLEVVQLLLAAGVDKGAVNKVGALASSIIIWSIVKYNAGWENGYGHRENEETIQSCETI